MADSINKVPTRDDLADMIKRAKKQADATIPFDLPIPVINGKGSVDRHHIPYFPRVDVVGKIVSPDGGSWSVIVWLNDKIQIKEQGIVQGQEFHKEITDLEFFTTDNHIHAEVQWSKPEDTTLNIHLDLTPYIIAQ
jgi:hypothetical protein